MRYSLKLVGNSYDFNAVCIIDDTVRDGYWVQDIYGREIKVTTDCFQNGYVNVVNSDTFNDAVKNGCSGYTVHITGKSDD